MKKQYDVEKLRNLDKKELLYEFSDVCDELYSKYDFFDYDKEKLYSYLENILYNDIHKIKFKVLTISNLKNVLQSKLNKLVLKEGFSSNKKAKMTINSYIDKKLNDLEGEEFLKKLDKFFYDIKYNVTPDILIDLLNNNEKINIFIKELAEKNQKVIKDFDSFSVSNTALISKLLQSYCILNELEIGQNVERDDKKLLNSEETIKLIKEAREGSKESRNILIEKNYGLLCSIAKKCLGRGLDFYELVDEGAFGIVTAIEKFDFDLGFSFSSYAYLWIRQSMQTAIEQQGSVYRLPVNIIRKIGKINSSKSKLEYKLGRIPTILEIAKDTNLSVKKVEEVLKAQNSLVSLNTPVQPEDSHTESTLGDFIENDDINVEKNEEKQELINKVRELLENANLTNQEREVIKYRFGIDQPKELTLEATGKILNVTRERIRQVQKKALAKLVPLNDLDSYAIFLDYPEQAKESAKKLVKSVYSKRL